MEEKKIILTAAGLKQYEEELEHLKTVKLYEIAEKIKEAREQGDLSENAEYDAAKDEQAATKARIDELEAMLKNVEVVDDDESDGVLVSIGSKVDVKDMIEDEKLSFKIVGSAEASSLDGRISNESPLGQALLGHKKNEVVKFQLGDNELKYKILKITRDEVK